MPSARLLGLFAALLPMAAPAQEVEYARVIFGADTVVAEVASTPEQRERGLMFREELPDGTGMLFVFEEAEIRGFWMRNTLIDLDIAMFDEDRVMIDLHQREAEDREVWDSSAPFAYALEVRRGWFEERGIGIGDVAEILFDDQPRPEPDSTRTSASMSPSSL